MASRLMAFGTYDVSPHPRFGVLLDGLSAAGHDVVEVNVPLGLDTAGAGTAAPSALAAARPGLRLAGTVGSTGMARAARHASRPGRRRARRLPRPLRRRPRPAGCSRAPRSCSTTCCSPATPPATAAPAAAAQPPCCTPRPPGAAPAPTWSSLDTAEHAALVPADRRAPDRRVPGRRATSRGSRPARPAPGRTPGPAAGGLLRPVHPACRARPRSPRRSPPWPTATTSGDDGRRGQDAGARALAGGSGAPTSSGSTGCRRTTFRDGRRATTSASGSSVPAPRPAGRAQQGLPGRGRRRRGRHRPTRRRSDGRWGRRDLRPAGDPAALAAGGAGPRRRPAAVERDGAGDHTGPATSSSPPAVVAPLQAALDHAAPPVRSP